MAHILGKDILNIVANYIGVSDEVVFRVREKEYYFLEQKGFRKNEFTVFNFCKLFDLDRKYVDGKIFYDCLIKYTKTKYKDGYLPSIVDLLQNIHTDDIDTNLLIVYIIQQCDTKYYEKYITNMNIMLYNNSIFSKQIHNIYDNYNKLHFTDIGKHSPRVYNKYMTEEYNDNMSAIIYKNRTHDLCLPPHQNYHTYFAKSSGCIDLENLEQLTDTNPFYNYTQPYMIVKKHEFEYNLEIFTNRLHLLFDRNAENKWDNFVIAGGSIFNCLNNYEDQDKETLTKSDIDIFLFGEKHIQKNTLDKLVNVIEENATILNIYKLSQNCIEIHTDRYRVIQLIMTNYFSPDDIINSFDFDTIKVYYDGTDIKGTVGFMSSVKFWCEVIKSYEPLSDKSKMRIIKLLKKGMRIYQSGLIINNKQTLCDYINSTINVKPVVKTHIGSVDDIIYAPIKISHLNSDEGLLKFHINNSYTNNLLEKPFHTELEYDTINYIVIGGDFTINDTTISVRLSENYNINILKTIITRGSIKFEINDDTRTISIYNLDKDKIIFGEATIRGKLLIITEHYLDPYIGREFLELFIDEIKT